MMTHSPNSNDKPTRMELTVNAANTTRIAAAGEKQKYDEHVWDILCNQTFIYNTKNVQKNMQKNVKKRPKNVRKCWMVAKLCQTNVPKNAVYF